jgi:hypothetical protein
VSRWCVDAARAVRTFTVPPASRFNVGVTGTGGLPADGVPELVDTTFGVLIESDVAIAVERAMYSDAGGVVWAAGTNASATRLP